MDEFEFFKKNRPIMFLAIKGLWAPGYTIDDLLNEARYGLWQAKQTWNPNHKVGWVTYAITIARRRVIDLVVAANRKKHSPFLSYSDLERSGCLNIPVDMPEANDSLPRVLHLLSQIHMTDIERKVMDCYMRDMGYNATGKELGISAKSVDNAYQRVLKKLKKISNPDTEGILLSPSDSTCA